MTDLEQSLIEGDTTPAAPAAVVRAGAAVAAAAPAPSRVNQHLSLHARADRVIARAVPQLRYRLRPFGWSGIAGGVSLVAALVIGVALLLPARQSINSLHQQLLSTTHNAPLPASQSLSPSQFASSLPSRGQVPALLSTILEQAKRSGVRLDQGKYTFTPAAGERLARYSFEFPIKGDYGRVRAFINSSLSVIPALGLDKLHIERKNVGDAAVSAEVGFIIYLRSGA